MFQPDLLKGKVILVTGGGTGLGRSMGARFLELGARLAIASRKADVLQQAAAEMQAQTGGEVFHAACDVRDPEQVERMINAVWDHYGAVDVLVNNAAGNFASPTERLSHRAVDTVLGIVLHGSFYCTLALGKKWIAAKRGGTVLNILATYAWTGSAYVVPSAVAKAGVMALTQSLAVEWGKYGIRMNGIAPGPFPTPGATMRLSPTADFNQMAIDRNPLKRVGEHSELANLAAYLVSDYAGYINGEVVVIDGGEWLKGAGEFSELDRLTPEDWERFAAQARGKK
jgi:NAD(P)-dependent dehydrogenase (short-subunit alcohol dehydrogenase family)